MADFLHVKGAEELKAMLMELPRTLQRRSLRRAVAAGSTLIRDQARNNAQGAPGPEVQTGALLKSIIAKRINERCAPGREVFYVTVRRGVKVKGVKLDAYYAGWVEYGHWINDSGISLRNMSNPRRNVKRGGLIASGASGGKYVAARPFIRPAYETKKGDAMKMIEAVMTTEVQTAAKK